MPQQVGLAWALLYGAARAGIGMHDIFFNAVAAFYLASYGLPNVAIGFLANERSFVGSVLGPVAGAVSDRLRWRWGRRKPFMLLMVPAALGYALLAAHPPVAAVVAVFVVGPILLGLGATAYEVLLPDIVPESRRGTVNGINRALAFLGGIVLLVVAAQVWEAHPGAVLLLVAGSLMLGLAITMWGVREPPPPDTLPEGPLQWRPSAYVRDVLRYRAASWYVAAYFVYWLGIGGITPFVTRFGNQELGIPQNETFVIMLAVMFGTLVAVGPAGWLGDKLGKRLVTQWGLGAFALIIIAGSQVQTLEQALLAMTLAGIAQAVPTALAYPLFTELVPSHRMGELSGLSTMIWSLAQPLGATLFGYLADSTGTFRVVMLAGGLALAAAWLVLLNVHAAPRLAPAPSQEPPPAAGERG